jgi:hypothetical protein
LSGPLFIGVFILVYLGLTIGLGIFIHLILKKLGYPKTAKYLTVAYGLIVLTIGIAIVFEDQLFTKNNAKELVEEQDIKLTDEFELLKNESISSIEESYHTFTLKISERNKQDAIAKIKNAVNFEPYDNGSKESLLYEQGDRYFGPKLIQNYETESSYIREYFQPSGRQGYAPTFRRISVSKTGNLLTFEDIDE